MIWTERSTDAPASRVSLGIKGRDTDCGLKIDKREVGPSSIPVPNSTTPFTGILRRINSFIQVRLRIKYVCNYPARTLIEISQSPLGADKMKVIYYTCTDSAE